MFGRSVPLPAAAIFSSQRAGLRRSASVSPRKGSGLRARWIRTPSLEPAASVAGLNIADAGL
eukprot:4027837-Alexandrium_andersonii.AAC.1